VHACTRGPVCNCARRHAHEHTGEAEAVRHPLRSGVNAYIALSSGNGLSCPRRLCDAEHHRKLDASIAAPGPRDFAVRNMPFRRSACRVHRIPLPTFLTIAKRPSQGERDGMNIAPSSILKTRIILRRRSGQSQQCRERNCLICPAGRGRPQPAAPCLNAARARCRAHGRLPEEAAGALDFCRRSDPASRWTTLHRTGPRPLGSFAIEGHR
jgi:hypothetical protein